jgi:hypothetical protein
MESSQHHQLIHQSLLRNYLICKFLNSNLVRWLNIAIIKNFAITKYNIVMMQHQGLFFTERLAQFQEIRFYASL